MKRVFSIVMLFTLAALTIAAQDINGTYFLKNIGTQKYLAAGSYWGTHAIVNEVGLDFTIATANGKSTLDSQVSNGNGRNYLNGEYVDGASFGWTFALTTDGNYTISDGSKYLTAGADGLVTLADDATATSAHWTLVTMADRLSALNAATAENAVDASFLIKGATFSRNDLRNSAWVRTKSGGNETIAGPPEERTTYGCEYWNNTFDIHQTIESLPEGVYEFTIAGFGTNGTTFIYANDTVRAFVNTTAAENFRTALDEIAAGQYTGNTTGKVVLLEGALTVGVKRTTNTKQDWAVIDDARLMYYGAVPAEAYKPLYDEALLAAKTVLQAEEYAVVTGEERTTLQQAIADNSQVEEQVEAYKAAITALKAAVDTFKESKGAYDALAATIAAMKNFDFTVYPYATEAKKAAALATLTVVPASAADALAKAEAVNGAFRQVAESSALLENVENATNFTSYISNPAAEQDIAAPWYVICGENSEGSMDVKNNEGWTDGNGSTTHRYFDGGHWEGQSWDVTLKQDVQLPKGKFMLTVKSRASVELTNFTLFAGDTKTEMQHIGNGGGLFNRGWNDASVVFEMTEAGTIAIGVQGVTSTLHNWMSFSDFRLVSFDKFETDNIGTVSMKWELSDVGNLGAVEMTGDEASISLLTTNYTQGSQIAKVVAMTSSNADTDYEAVVYNPPFASFTPTTRVETATAGHDISFSVKPVSGHQLKLTRISFDCARVGTDGGAADAVVKLQGGTTRQLSPVTILRNKISANNSTGFGHNEFEIGDLMVTDAGMQLVLSIYQLNGVDNATPKSMAFRNVVIEGVMDEDIFDVSHYLSDFTCKVKTGIDEAAAVSLFSLIKDLKNGEKVRFTTRLYAKPTDFTVTLKPTLGAGYDIATYYAEATNTLTVDIRNGGSKLFGFSIQFIVSNRPPKGQPVALKRGLMALHSGSGNLVSWRARKSDGRNYKFILYSGSATAQKTKLNSGKFIMGKTNFLDTSGTAGTYYKLEVYDGNNQLVETEVSQPAWDNQTKYITLQGGAPTDPTTFNATYTPNDASFCDMDGDGEYEIILKWAPSNEKDAASNGDTSPAFYSCYKLDGTRLWMLHTGQNMFNSAHTTPFVAWDLDGDGFGEFMVKTAPGAIDGEGNYVLLGNDNPNENLKSGLGKQDHGSEYITVFDGTSGAELKTIPYHTAYGDVSTSFWGDSKQNRSERYLAGIAWLSGEDENPSAIFARGYYSGCRIGAYDWDGSNLTLRWLHSGSAANAGTVTYADGTVKNLSKSVYGEGAHSFVVGDVTGDGKQEITYGSGAVNADGTTLYRTGFGHGDATHLSDFIPSRPGLEFFMVHEHSPYGADLRDARTGEVIWRVTAGGDTGRGIMAHFNPEAENAYWQSSADAGLYDTSGNTILETCTHGGGASLNNRVFWNGTLADDFYDKSVLEYWNPEGNGFWRMQVNGGNYTIGNLNNGTKFNPCVLGDLLGDWREEIVTWTESEGNYQLIINATNYETDYTFPHLMDDYAYRAQLIAQNSVYNQPPHVSYDPRTVKTIVPETFEGPAVSNSEVSVKKYWGSLYVTYPVIIPDDVTAWAVTNRSADGSDTLKLTKIAAGKIIPKDRAIIFNTDNASPRFVPTSLASTATVSTTYAKGFYCDSLVADVNSYKFTYEFRNGDRGVGFYRTYGQKAIPGGKAYASFGVSTVSGAKSYVVGCYYDPELTGIEQMKQCSTEDDHALYSIEGLRLTKEPAHGIYIKNGRKYVK